MNKLERLLFTILQLWGIFLTLIGFIVVILFFIVVPSPEHGLLESPSLVNIANILTMIFGFTLTGLGPILAIVAKNKLNELV